MSSSPASFIPHANATYLDMSYWEQRFEEEDEYEWCKDYSCFRHLLLEQVKPHHRVLVIGCGNSRMSERLHRDGVRDVTSTDLSHTVVRRMRERCAQDPATAAIRWSVADMLALPFEDGSFDVVIEKGAIEVLFVDSESAWNPSAEVVARVSTALREAHRVLSPDGALLSISFGQPHFRRPLFEARGLTWKMEYRTFGEGFHYYFYILRKGLKDPSVAFERSAGHPLSEGEGAAGIKSESMEHEHMDDEDCLLAFCELGLAPDGEGDRESVAQTVEAVRCYDEPQRT